MIWYTPPSDFYDLIYHLVFLLIVFFSTRWFEWFGSMVRCLSCHGILLTCYHEPKLLLLWQCCYENRLIQTLFDFFIAYAYVSFFLSNVEVAWFLWDLIQYPLKWCPHSRDKWIRSNPIRCFVSILCMDIGICIFTWKCLQFMAKSLSGCSWRNIFKLCCLHFLSSPVSPRPYGVTSRNIYDSWLAEDLCTVLCTVLGWHIQYQSLISVNIKHGN